MNFYHMLFATLVCLVPKHIIPICLINMKYFLTLSDQQSMFGYTLYSYTYKNVYKVMDIIDIIMLNLSITYCILIPNTYKFCLLCRVMKYIIEMHLLLFINTNFWYVDLFSPLPDFTLYFSAIITSLFNGKVV